ncbi:hypothetical protein GW891_00005, partial [bacterium]|nr:hypothetical protein [bacterium]
PNIPYFSHTLFTIKPKNTINLFNFIIYIIYVFKKIYSNFCNYKFT